MILQYELALLRLAIAGHVREFAGSNQRVPLITAALNIDDLNPV